MQEIVINKGYTIQPHSYTDEAIQPHSYTDVNQAHTPPCSAHTNTPHTHTSAPCKGDYQEKYPNDKTGLGFLTFLVSLMVFVSFHIVWVEKKHELL